jgi:hypothetical protein
MAKKAKAPNPFTGRRQIVSMRAWDEEFIIFFTGIPDLKATLPHA